VEEADEVARARGLTRFVSAQNEYSLLKRDAERELVPVCEQLGLGLIPYFPLASGLLTGKYRRGESAPPGSRLAECIDATDDATWDQIDELEAFAHTRGVELLDVAIGGLAAMPAVASVIAGATTPEQARANAAAGKWEPTAADLEELTALRVP
jgi:aryl-alcohol dehydrogenase-like predicted oxidoreductase